MWQVLGQDRAIRFLENSIARGEPAHAYLLTGPPHVGKMTLARNFAQALNCSSSPAPCGHCPSCTRIASSKYSDVQVITRLKDEKTGRFKRDISIEQMRDVQKAAQFPPYEGKFKVFIIDGAELLSSDAANCFLKTLEEPPARVIFLLLTSKESGVLPTVVSRCQRLELHPMPSNQVENALIAQGEDKSQAQLLAHLSQGCLGWALQAKIEPQLLQQRQEKTDLFRQLAKSGYEIRFGVAAELAVQFEREPEQVTTVLETWSMWWRDLLLIKEKCRQWVVNVDQMAELEQSEANVFSVTQIKGAIKNIQLTIRYLRQNANPRLALEVLMLSIPLPFPA